MKYTIQVSNHPEAGARIPTAAADKSWETKYDGEIATAREARLAVDDLSLWYKHVRAFRGNGTIGRMFYAVLRAR